MKGRKKEGVTKKEIFLQCIRKNGRYRKRKKGKLNKKNESEKEKTKSE